MMMNHTRDIGLGQRSAPAVAQILLGQPAQITDRFLSAPRVFHGRKNVAGLGIEEHLSLPRRIEKIVIALRRLLRFDQVDIVKKRRRQVVHAVPCAARIVGAFEKTLGAGNRVGLHQIGVQ